MKITASIVLFNNSPNVLTKAINSFLSVEQPVKLYLIDNSPNDDLKDMMINEGIVYYHNPSNPGFGAGHNIAIKMAIETGSNYHFIVNPDTYFQGNVVMPMVEYMNANSKTGMLMPEILYPDGNVQYLPKLLPSPLNILLRKLKRPAGLYTNNINKYEMRFVPKDEIYISPILSGCFTLLNLEAIKEVGGYDDEYFMYFEDWDLSRRMAEKYATVYFPKVSVYHGYDSGANKSFRLFKIYIKSAFHYFNKWGWFFDDKRRKINAKTLNQFKQ
jgi:GT2 family glycosyltransferase